MRFVKGQSGNPSGRPPIDREFRARCQAFMTRKGWAALEEMADDSESPHRFKALELIGAYAFGKPTQPHSGDTDMPPVQVSVRFDDASDTDADQG